MLNVISSLPVLLHSPRWWYSSYWLAPSCRCRRTPPGKPTRTRQPWKWAPSTRWAQTCPALETTTEKMRQVWIFQWSTQRQTGLLECCINQPPASTVELCCTLQESFALSCFLPPTAGNEMSLQVQWRSARRRTCAGTTLRASSTTHMWFTNAQPDVAEKNRWSQSCCKSCIETKSEEEALRKSFPGENLQFAGVPLLWSMISRIASDSRRSKTNKSTNAAHWFLCLCGHSALCVCEHPCCLLLQCYFPMWLN